MNDTKTTPLKPVISTKDFKTSGERKESDSDDGYEDGFDEKVDEKEGLNEIERLRRAMEKEKNKA
jgi:hypothetical protein